MMDLDRLVENPKNPNKHGDKQIKLLAKIMSHQGWRHPITVSKRSGFIVAGHGRLAAARLNGWESAPIDLQDFETEADEYAHMIADNKIAELAEHDDEMMIKDLKLSFEDMDFELLGIPDFELPPDEDPERDEKEDDVPDSVETRAQLGDVWLLGDHRLMCGDSTDKECVGRLMGGAKADMVFTDPPYGVNYDGGIQFTAEGCQKGSREKLRGDHSQDIYTHSVPIMAEYSEGPIYTWYAASQGKQLYNALDKCGDYHAMIVWVKNGGYAALNASYKQKHEPCVFWKPKGKTLKWCGPTTENTIWEMDKEGVNKLHPTQKPVALAERAIKNHTSKSVLDLFGGSGSTLIACEKTNRKCYMMEIDPHYCDIIIKRWEDYAGKKAQQVI